MRKLVIFSAFAFITVIIASCGSSNNVANNRMISKRKYTNGFFINKKGQFKTSDEAQKEEKLEDRKIARIDKKELRAERIAAKKESRTQSNENVQLAENITYININPREEYPESVESFLSNDNVDVEQDEQQSKNGYKVQTIEQVPATSRKASEKESSDFWRAAGSINTVLLVIIAIIIPPLAVGLFEGITTRFWIDLILALVGWGVGFWLLGPGLGLLCGLVAVIYAILIVVSAI